MWILPLGLEPVQQKTLAIVFLMLVFWIAEPIDHGLTALIGCYLFWALDVSKFSVAFSGFVNSTPWFLFGALLMGEAATRTGLAKRISFLVMKRVGSSQPQILFGLLLLSFLLNFFVPSGMGRLAVIAPIAAGIVKSFGVGNRSNLAKGLFLILTYTAGLSDVMIMSGAASILTRGIIEEQTGIQVLWSEWLVAFLPLTVFTIFVSMLIVQRLFPAELNELPGGRQYFQESLEKMGPWSLEEKRALAWFLLAVALWSTDSVHHVSPAIIGLGVGLLLSVPKLGVLDAKAIKQINFFLIIFSAGALSMGNVLLKTNTLPLLTDRLISLITPLLSNPFSYTVTLYFAGFFYHFILANRQSMLITSLPALLHLALTNGYSVVALSFLWSFTGSASLFIHQSAVYVMGYSYGYFDSKDFVKLGAILTVVQGVLLVILVQFYWPLIGLNWMK
jgi:anion transporter